MNDMPHDHPHGHDHDHGHPTGFDPHAPASDFGDERSRWFEVASDVMRDMLIEQNVIAAREVRKQIELMESKTIQLGGRLVARAWVDPAFRETLLKDGKAEFRPVKTGLLGELSVEVKEGLEGGETLVTGPFRALRSLKPGDAAEAEKKPGRAPSAD